MFAKYLILIGRTFIAAFFIVNIFNIIPLNINNNLWLTQVSMLLVDTASLLLLGLACLKICSIYLIKNYEKKIPIEDSGHNNFFILTQEKHINNNNKISKYLMILFIVLAFFQFYILFKGMSQINNRYVNQYDQIENKYTEQKNILEKEFPIKLEGINDNLENKLDLLNMKRDDFLLELDKAISKARFLLARGNIKVFIMSGIWAYGLFKLSSLSDKEWKD